MSSNDTLINKIAELAINNTFGVNNTKSVDISNNNNVDELFKNDNTNKWIKLISTDKIIKFSDYDKKDYFHLVANIVLDNDVDKNGKKKRKTLIKFEPTIDITDFNNPDEWIYVFTINDLIVKFGGTRKGLKNRSGSYLSGHQIKERGGSNSCSKTNGYIYNTFVFYAQLNCSIKMYAYKLPVNEIEIEVFDKKVKIKTQTFHAYESIIMNDYKKSYNHIPILCDNCDPDYRD
jgi:hypothetical protein